MLADLKGLRGKFNKNDEGIRIKGAKFHFRRIKRMKEGRGIENIKALKLIPYISSSKLVNVS